MVFSSSLFIFAFLPAFLLIYYSVGNKLKNITILAFSIFFYAWGAPKFVFVVLSSLLINFYIVGALNRQRAYRKLMLWLSILINVGLLAYFKYANFFVENINVLLGNIGVDAVHWTHVALPIGISFFTFQSLTYTLDVYRGVHAPLKKPGDYLLYILMFPQLIAGPIVRFHSIADEIENRGLNESFENRITGFSRFVIGLAKKVLLANTLGAQADAIFGNLDTLDSLSAWIGILAYTFQIYFDFSGYSDMAIGIGRMIGFTFPENFNNPYISQNITEFWRRWHITLGTWMRDYLYIPLGGSRTKTKRRLYLNLWVVFLISGLWHGASWNFVVWGAYHGLFLILDRLFLIKLLSKVGRLTRVTLTFITVVVGWVFFRIESFSDSLHVLRQMFVVKLNFATELTPEFILVLILSLVFSFITLTKSGRRLERYMYPNGERTSALPVYYLLIAILFVLSVAYITSFGFNPFIYFRF